MISWAVSLYHGGARDNRPRSAVLDWPQLLSLLSRHSPALADADKRTLPAWSPARLAEGATRSNDAVQAVSCIVLDYDDGTDSEAAMRPWLDWPCVVHSSWSHAAELPKYRLVIPLGEPVPLRAWRWVWAWAAARAAGTIDRSCKDASRLYFLPAQRGDGPVFSRIHDPDRELLRPEWRRQSEEALEQAGRSPAKVAAKAAAARIDCQPVAYGLGEQARAEQLARDPARRAMCARALGASTTSDRAHGIRCPKCGDLSVWFLLAPDRTSGASCNHRNSCGWHGSLETLFKE